jgi:hypothetical protein
MLENLNTSVTKVVGEGGKLTVLGDKNGFTAFVTNREREVVKVKSAQTIQGVLSAIGAGVVARPPLYAPGSKC